jgi:hypothetical protein
MTCGAYRKHRGHEPPERERSTITMYTIEYDGAAPAPWKITTDDGCTWYAESEAEAAVELAEFIIERAQALRALPALPDGAVLI